ncbi:MAG: malonyl-CoA decarboxylase [Pseudomonadota bacterium]
MTETSIFWKVIESVSDQGRRLIRLGDGGNVKNASIDRLGRALVSEKGEASGVALAALLIERYGALETSDKQAFFRLLLDEFGPDWEASRQALAALETNPDDATALSRLHYAAEPKRQELLRRINLAPGGITALVAMRSDLLGIMTSDPDLDVVDADFEHLFRSWFNRGFLQLARIDWQTPAAILEKIIKYEAVHAIEGWDDLRRRVDAPDRRLYAFFHPALSDGPLIFVEVALTRDTPTSIKEILAEDREPIPVENVSTAVFYSISNCQRGLRGVSFGNFLIKQVVDELRNDLPQLRTFATLSPIPGLSRWLREEAALQSNALTDRDRQIIDGLTGDESLIDRAPDTEARKAMISLAGQYLVREKAEDGRPVDPVARFHLGNGARLERINWLADTSAKGLAESHGLMVNYLYVADEIEANHEAFAKHGAVAVSSSVRRLLRSQRSAERSKTSPVPAEAAGP